MELSMLSMLVFKTLLLFFSISQSYSSNTTMLSKCPEKERFALLKFKATFYGISCNHDTNLFGADLKTWSIGSKNGDCCSWDGIECDEHSGHVIGLDLYSSCLYGSINSDSSIFELVHLQWLNLSFNDFHYSKIPSAISNLSMLTSLELHNSNFSGQIPLEILHMTNLSLLDLSCNQLTLMKPSLGDLVQTLIKLEKLHLDKVNISSSMPDYFSRLSSLKSLSLYDCGLQGQIPSSMANLTFMSLGMNNLAGDFTPSFWNLTQLEFLDLECNGFTGEIFSQLLRSTKLVYLDLACNEFYGQIPTTLSHHLKSLSLLSIYSNNFSGTINLDVFLKLENLRGLDLSFNNFSLIEEPTIKSHRNLIDVGLASCNLTSFPKFLRDQGSLHYIDLSFNNISGEVPEWFLNVSTKELYFLNLSHNHLTGVERNLPLIRWEQLVTLDLRFNQLKGSLLSLSVNTSLRYYLVSNNEFSGEIPTWMCTLVTLVVLDLGNNDLSGKIPPCFTNLVSHGNLLLLSLRSNNFKGQIPQLGKDRCNLVMIDMSSNQLEGLIPRDIENCINLQFLNMGYNRINDVFPFWLGKLPALSVLMLDSNRLHGIIKKPEGNYHFPKLRIISLSKNGFIGSLPSLYFASWSAMKGDVHTEGQLQYLSRSISVYLYTVSNYFTGRAIERSYYYSFRIDNKGMQMEYTKIQRSFVVIDLSNNNFRGEIPDSIGTLKRLHLLNLSYNMLTGPIPFNLNGLTDLESLDLSHNKLSGEIPQQLTDLTALSSFDVSFNQLRVPIPFSKQFGTFETTSYQGNAGLRGIPLSRKCGNSMDASSAPSSEKDQASNSWIEINWKIVCMGYISGFVIGVTMGMRRM